jgi:hypothetical protein
MSNAITPSLKVPDTFNPISKEQSKADRKDEPF